MKGKKLLATLLSFIFIFLNVSLISYAQEDEYLNEYAEGEVLFGYEPPISTNSLFKSKKSFCTQLIEAGVSEYEELFKDDEEISANSVTTNSSSDEPTVYHAKITGDVIETCKKLENIDGITYAEPNFVFHTDSYTPPRELSSSSGMYNQYQKWYLDDTMHIKSTWETYYTTGENVTVAVIDNGFCTTASDFPTNLWLNSQGTPGWNTYANNSDISAVKKPDGTNLDDTNHGSNVAGIIGMTSNGSGGIGAAYGAKLMLIKVAGYSSGRSSTYMTVSAVASGIDYAVNNNADLITMSIGINSSSSTLLNAVNRAYNAGIPFFASAGNDAYSTSTKLNYPAAYENKVIGVMAIDKTDPTQLSNFSNYDVSSNKYYDVAAPGVGILGCATSSYTLMSGTSQSTPLVAACAALYLSVYPDASITTLYNAIKNSPTKRVKSNSTVVTNKTYYYKSVDALELLNYSRVVPVLNKNYDTQVFVDNNRNFIYGLDEGYTDFSQYITIQSGTGNGELYPTRYGNGTGSEFRLYDKNRLYYKSYYIVIFGDINGDGVADAQDSVMLNCIKGNLMQGSDSQMFAADVDISNTVNDDDVLMISKKAVGLDYISQSR